ncbi:MAG: alpha/beta hydrolase [Daejeonella sp.]|uniref:alpha/beta hydrolase n=1 Tax=Daejeonella sp. TaxID=2805397 RepID=UPI00273255AA|nr:alpha/beta hydrolase [Daejeonella sp.]MDP3469838.1 alpha/beta hydrolase [Daejeonella sp.]
MKLKYFLLILILASVLELSAKVLISKDIPYRENSTDIRNRLDVYYPENTQKSKDVLVFIHGGSWNSGKKEIYWWLGKNMARKNVVSVIINYSLSPESQYENMALDCALAIKWVKDSIARFGGRSDRIFVMGHSAGGHLAALINNDPRFFESTGIPNPIKGVILNDSFGLDMYEYLTVAEPDEHTEDFLNAFSRDQETWKTASPMYYLQNVMKPFLVFVGERTYPAIKLQSKRLYDELLKANKTIEMKYIERKRHKGMIIQMISRKNQMYDLILEFMAKA